MCTQAVVDLPAGRGRSSRSQAPWDSSVMLTAAVEVPAAADAAGSAEPAWTWVSPGARGKGGGVGSGLRLHGPTPP